MAKAKAKPAAPRFNYPEPQDRRIGCKVGWYYYKEKSDAEHAAKVAAVHADHRAGEGYDFGYCAPGSIRLVGEGEYAGLYEVCIP